MYFFDPVYFLYIAPALLLAVWAQFRVRSAYAEAQQVPAAMSGAEAARRVLDSAGLYNVAIEPVAGELSDHYDPHGKVLRLSSGVYAHDRWPPSASPPTKRGTLCEMPAS